MGTPRPRFRAADTALLRVPTLPAARAAATRVDIDGSPERLTAFLREVLADPLFREAVDVAGGGLADTLARLDADRPVDPAKLTRAAHAVARYLLRTTGRPTPFGLFAGVALAGFDATAKVRTGDRHVKGVRPDAVWLAAGTDAWQRRSDVLGGLRIVANDLCTVRGDRLVLPYVRQDAADDRARPVQELSVRYTPPVRAAVEAARQPVPYAELFEQLSGWFPRASAAMVEAMLVQLVDQQLLLTDLGPPAHGADPLGHVLDRLVGTPGHTELETVADRLADYADQPLGAGRPQWHAAVTAMRALHPAEKPPVQVDLRFDADVTLPVAVAEEAARAAEVLWRLSPVDGAPEHLRQYHGAFLERHGAHTLVPLKELVDPERGLGAPAGYFVPPSDRRLEPAPDRESARDAALMALAQRALLHGGDLVLDADTVDRLATDGGTPPDTLELAVHVLAASTTALDAGEFRLAVAPGTGANTAGAMFGRFGCLFPDGAYPTAAEERPDGPVSAQLVFQPVHARAGNVLRVPLIRDRILAVGTFADHSAADVLGVGDLLVGADHDRLYLVSARHGRRIDALSPHMLNVGYSTANAVRLIREITASGTRGLTGWSWGRAALLPRLPRVTYGRTVLSPASWQVPAALRDRDMTWQNWSAELDGWRGRWQVPERVQVLVNDHRIELDLTVPLHQRLLRDELVRRAGAVVCEPPGTEAETGWLHGHANELVVPLTSVAGSSQVAESGNARVAASGVALAARSGVSGAAAVRNAEATGPTIPAPGAAAVHPQAAPLPRHSPAPRHLPGGEWLYAKLYCARGRHDELLAGPVSSLVAALPDGVDRWFFIRYADPDPHLRLRFHGTPALLWGQLLPQMHAWAEDLCGSGLANRLTLDGYEPETGRYGGPDALESSERMFAADSASALATLRLRATGLDLPTGLLLAADTVDLPRSFGDPDWIDWLAGPHPRGPRHPAFAAVRREAVALLDPYGDGTGLAAVEGGPALLDIWRRRAPAVAAYGDTVRALAEAGRLHGTRDSVLDAVLHMHHNRLVGVDPQGEAGALAIARGAVAAHRDRRRHGA
ncbi:lantibiotic dehydratase [Longispora sp. NPDC051575]|uniref:lantibiotic dehydratase n=1 Tax=Longispora sp. NPDC051575 TaxID=3154943 RepID=UPI0034197945